LLARGAARAEARDLLAKGGVVVAEAVGDVLLTAVLDADSAEGFIEALGIGRRLKEEAARWGLVHHGAPECDRGRCRRGIWDKQNVPGNLGGSGDETAAAHGKDSRQRSSAGEREAPGSPKGVAGKTASNDRPVTPERERLPKHRRSTSAV